MKWEEYYEDELIENMITVFGSSYRTKCGFFYVVDKFKSRSPPNHQFDFKKLNWLEEQLMAKMPKRNKSKDNPYNLIFDENEQIYMVEFVDNKRVIHKIKISTEVYKAFDEFELEDVSQIHKYQRHIEHNEIYEDKLNTRIINKQPSIDELVEQKILKEELKGAINELPKIQKNRLIKYYFEDMTFEEIAKEENCTKRAVKFSVDIALEKISKKIKK